MLDLFKNLYEQNDFKVTVYENNILFSVKENKQYYFTIQYNKNEFEGFYDGEKSKNLINIFDTLKKNKSDIQKNTSLIICLKLTSMHEITQTLKNIIFSIEEDEYFFRKYVVVFTKKSIKNIDIKNNIYKQLHEIIKKEDMMEKYQDNGYFCDEFFLAMQLFVKLPFIVYDVNSTQFIPVEDKLKEVIKANNANDIYEKVINFKEKLKDHRNAYFTELKDAFLAEDDKNILNDFFKHFEEIE
ncbi:hypothetical protein AN1V17_00910 [Vallitalea sediminicola]